MVNISESHYLQIMSAVGFPIITIEDLSNGKMTDENVKDLFVWQALQLYFKYFPVETTQEVSVSGRFSVDFPDENVYGIVDARLVSSEYAGGAGSRSPFINTINYSVSRKSMYGTNNHYDMIGAKMLERAEQKLARSLNRVIKRNVDHKNRRLIGYTNDPGVLAITWASYSKDFDDVQYHFQEDVVKLAQSFVLRYFGELRNQLAGSLPGELDGSDFISRADDLYDNIIDKWNQHTKVVVFRS